MESPFKFESMTQDEIKKKIKQQIISFVESTLNIDTSDDEIWMEDSTIDKSEFDDNLDDTAEEIIKILM